MVKNAVDVVGTGSPNTSDLRQWTLFDDGTDSFLYYNSDPEGAGSYTLKQTFSAVNAGILRKPAGVTDGIACLTWAGGTATSYTDALTGGLGAKTNLTTLGLTIPLADGTAGSIPSGSHGNYSGNEIVGEDTGIDNPDTDSLFVAMPVIDLGVPCTVTLTRAQFKRNPNTSGGDAVKYFWYDENGNEVANQLMGSITLTTSYQTYTSVATRSNVRYIALQGLVAIQTPYCDNIYIEYTPNGEVYTHYSSNTGTTMPSVTVGTYGGDEPAFDCDDFNLGVHAVAANRSIYYTNTYTGSYTELTGLAGVNGTDTITCVRIPYRKLATQALNDDETSLQFIYCTSGGYIGGVTFNATSGAIAAESDMSITISATDYYVIKGNSLSTYGDNTQIIYAFVKPVGGGSTKLVKSTDGGSTWSIKNSGFDGDYIYITETADGGAGAKIWVAGADGVGYSNNGGVTIIIKYDAATVKAVQGYA